MKITLHFQENTQHIGLLRVDYNGPHVNPQTITDSVPDAFNAYCGASFSLPHIHYFIEGYKPLAWALPLADADFPVKQISDLEDFRRALTAFCATINLTTTINCDGRLFL